MENTTNNEELILQRNEFNKHVKLENDIEKYKKEIQDLILKPIDIKFDNYVNNQTSIDEHETIFNLDTKIVDLSLNVRARIFFSTIIL